MGADKRMKRAMDALIRWPSVSMQEAVMSHGDRFVYCDQSWGQRMGADKRMKQATDALIRC
jgi:hypothetical protein